MLILIVTIELVFQKGPDKLFTSKTIWKKTKNDTKIETKEKICTQTSQNGVTKKCSI